MADPRVQQARERAERIVGITGRSISGMAEDVLYLADRVAELDAALGQAVVMANENGAEAAALADRVAALETALRFYADENNWTQPTSWGGRIYYDDGAAQNDCGKVARDALAGSGADTQEQQP